jgi:hypothetical protein
MAPLGIQRTPEIIISSCVPAVVLLVTLPPFPTLRFVG